MQKRVIGRSVSGAMQKARGNTVRYIRSLACHTIVCIGAVVFWVLIPHYYTGYLFWLLLAADTLIPAAFFFLFRPKQDVQAAPSAEQKRHRYLNVTFHVIVVSEVFVCLFWVLAALPTGAREVGLWGLLLEELVVMVSLLVWVMESQRGMLEVFAGKRILDIQLWTLFIVGSISFVYLFFHFPINLRKLGIVLSLAVILYSLCYTNFKSANSNWRFAQLGTCIMVACMLFVTLNLLLDRPPYERHSYSVIEIGGYRHGITCRLDDGRTFKSRSDSARVGDRGLVYVCDGWFQEEYYSYRP